MICGNYISEQHEVIDVHRHENNPLMFVVEYGKESVDFLNADKQEPIQEFILERWDSEKVMFHVEENEIHVLDNGILKKFVLDQHFA